MPPKSAKKAAATKPKAAAAKTPASTKGKTFTAKADAEAATKVTSTVATASTTPAKKTRKSVTFSPESKGAPAGVVTPGKAADAAAAAKKSPAVAKKAKEAAADKKKKAAPKQYKVLQLRFLPTEFQEPEIERFVSQLAAVKSCFCVRQKRTHASTGVAYVRLEDEDDIADLVSECNGMLLGGRVVRAKKVALKRAMPSKNSIDKRRFQDQRHRYRGDALRRFDMSKKRVAAILIKQARNEKTINKELEKLGIKYSFNGFQDQLAKLPKDNFLSKKDVQAARKEKKEKTAAAKKEKAATNKVKARAALAKKLTKKRKGRNASA